MPSAPSAPSAKSPSSGTTPNAPQGWLLEPGAARRRAHRGDPPRPRHPLRRHQRRARHARVGLRQPVLRPRPGREPDQAAQEPAPIRPHLVPFGARKPGPPRAAHGRVLADAGRQRRHPQGPRPRHGRVHHAAPSVAQGRSQGRRDPPPRAHRLRGPVSRGRPHPRPHGSPDEAPDLTDGAEPLTPQPVRPSSAAPLSQSPTPAQPAE